MTANPRLYRTRINLAVQADSAGEAEQRAFAIADLLHRMQEVMRDTGPRQEVPDLCNKLLTALDDPGKPVRIVMDWPEPPRG
jgi:hypothetical protein